MPCRARVAPASAVRRRTCDRCHDQQPVRRRGRSVGQRLRHRLQEQPYSAGGSRRDHRDGGRQRHSWLRRRRRPADVGAASGAGWSRRRRRRQPAHRRHGQRSNSPSDARLAGRGIRGGSAVIAPIGKSSRLQTPRAPMHLHRGSRLIARRATGTACARRPARAPSPDQRPTAASNPRVRSYSSANAAAERPSACPAEMSNG